LLELLDERLGMITVLAPPRSLLYDVPLRGAREANVPLFQRDRSSRRTVSASTRRPAPHILFRIAQGLVQGGTVFLVELISWIER
jgi:hypothetical protein